MRPLRRQHAERFALLFAAVLAGCSGAPPKQAGEENNFNETPKGPAPSDTPPPSDAPKAAPKADSAEGASLNEDQKAQMEIALRRGGDKASKCVDVVADAPRGEGEVKVIFDGQKGRCVDVNVGPPFAGTPVEACIKRAFVGEIIVPFEGELEVPYTVKLAAKAAEEADKSKGKDKGKPKDKKK